MNKIARFSALAVVLAASVGTTAFAATSTVTGGYAQSDMQGEANKAGGFNLKYRYEQDNNPLGVIGSFTYTEKDRSESGVYKKGQYYGITAGPAYDYGFSYGAGLQFNPIENVALDFSYEQSRIRNVDVGTWIAGVGYRF
ncbi:MAG: Ail/Lom family outer membrane beta-barrel protein [Klebsiella michiganensis]|nr:Ail/Lom family outer membrane beta-barrel protein [Klebsiella michiganensis]